MIKCVDFDKTGAWYVFSESNGALLNSLMLKKMQTSYGNLQMSASLQTQVLMVWVKFWSTSNSSVPEE